MTPLGVNYRVFLCSVQSPELRLTLFRETLFVCLVQSPRLWLTVEEIGFFLDYDSSLGKTLFSALYKAQGCGGLLTGEFYCLGCLVLSPRVRLTVFVGFDSSGD